MKKKIVAAVFVLFAVCKYTSVTAQPSPTFPSGFSSQYVQTNVTYQLPVGLTFNFDGSQMFVWEKGGKLFVNNYNSGTGKYDLQTDPVVDLTDEVGDWGDMGFLGFALDPSFTTTGNIYLMYVVDQGYLLTGTPDLSKNNRATIGRITKYNTTFTGGKLKVINGSRQILLGDAVNNGIPILASSHGVGSLQFGSDGTLLASCGDGASFAATDAGGDLDWRNKPPSGYNGSYAVEGISLGIIRAQEDVGAFRSQMINSFSGKVLRLNPQNGEGYTSNPYYDASDPKAPKSLVWALGLRNPFRFSIKPNTGSIFPDNGDPGALYITDVGWNEYEEISVCDDASENFGWPIWEGVSYMYNYYELCTNGFACVYNLDEPNPEGGCDPYFKFRDMIKNPKPNGDKSIKNPCNNSVYIGSSNTNDPTDKTANRYVHKPPLLDWHHTLPNTTRFFVFNPDGSAGWDVIGPSELVKGTPFNGNASIGGGFYIGDKYPPEYNNTFFTGNYGPPGWLRNLEFSAPQENILTEVKTFGQDVTAFFIRQSPIDGLLYYVSYRDPNVSTSEGRIRKLVYGGNLPPVVKINIENNGGLNYGSSPLTIDFSSTGTSDPEGTTLTYKWNFGDGSPTSSAQNPTHTFSNPGVASFTVTLQVTDAGSPVQTESQSIIISVNNTPPVIDITSPVNNSYYATGQRQTYSLTADVSDAQTSNNNQLAYEWQAFLKHNTHEHPGPLQNNQTGSTVVDGEGCGGETYYYMVRLTVTDPQGLSTIAESKIFPDCIATPVKLLTFSAYEKYHNVNLAWTTANESKIQAYEVERSSDGIGFSKIGEVGPKDGSGGSVKQYNFLDPTPVSGKSYYRLRIVNIDGTVEYSLIISITLKDQMSPDAIKAYPIPFKNDLAILAGFEKSGDAQIQIIDVQGRILQNRKQFVTEGTRVLTLGSLQDIKPGIYFVKIIQNGVERKVKVMKMEN